MKGNSRLTGVMYFVVCCLTAVIFAACQSGPETLGDGPPLVQTADSIVFSYELAKPKPVAEDLRPLGSTKWQVMSITPKPERPYSTMILHFQPDGNVSQVTTYGDGTVKSETSRYHIVGSTMIINKPKNDLNIRFKVEGNSLIMDTGEYSMLLLRVN